MKEIPILVSTPLVPPIKTGIKTMTRRLSGLDSINERPNDWEFVRFEDNSKVGLNAVFKRKGTILHTSIPCRYGRQGSLLWVRERFCYGRIAVGELPDGRDSKPYVSQCTGEKDFIPYEYCLSDDIEIKDVAWKPSIHMLKKDARIWLQVESVRVERLQDISEEDAIAEGIKPAGCEDHLACPSKLCINECVDKGHWWNYLAPDGEDFPCFTARESFESLWKSINGADSWAANPFCWVIQFTVLSTTGKPIIQTTTD